MIFVFLSILAYSSQNLANKEMGRRFGHLKGSGLLQSFACVFWAAVTMFLTGTFEIINGKYLISAAIFGLSYVGVIYLIIYGMQIGSIGGTTMMVNLGLFFSTIFGMIKFKDEITVLTGIGMACMLAVIFLTLPSAKERKENPNKLKWFFVALTAALGNGLLGSLKRLVSEWGKGTGDNSFSMTNFLFWAFSFSTVFCLIILLLIARPGKNTISTLYSGKNIFRTLPMGIISGAGSAGGNLFQMLAISKGVSSVVVFPVCAGCLISTAYLYSVIIYKELKIDLKNIISLILCIIGLALASI